MKLLLGVILFMALAVRLYGINHGLPYGYQIDEKFFVNHAMGFGTGDLNPHSFHKPGSTVMYFMFIEYGLFFVFGWIFGLFQTVEDFAGLFISDPSMFYLIGRTTMAFIGTFTVFLVYRMGQQLHSTHAGILAALFFAFSYMAVGISHLVFTDTPLTFLCVLAMFFFHRIITYGKTRDYIWGGILLGITVATKYNGVVLLVPLGIAHILQENREDKGLFVRLFDKRIIMSIAMSVVAFIICCPFSVLDFSSFSSDILWQLKRIQSGSVGSGTENAWRYYFFHGLPLSMGIGLAFISVISFFYVLIKRQTKYMPVVGFTFFFFLSICNSKVGVEKYILPVLPFLSLFSGLFIVEIFSKISVSRPFAKKLLIPFVLLLIAEPLTESIYNDYLLTQKDTRTEAKEWIEENISEGTKIAIDSGNFSVDKFSPPLNDSKESLMAMLMELEKNAPVNWASSIKKIQQYMQIRLKYQKGKGYNLVRIVNNTEGVIFPDLSVSDFIDKKVEYVVISSYVYKLYEDPSYKRSYPEVSQFYDDFYSSFDRCCELTKTFYPLTDKGPGPIIKIYKGPYKSNL